ncbi:MAG: hypothetical protein K2X81_03315 [Candidatus Obscuribacterales bacterium]|nr:hypothetical protein [Candidatus Obscuribacterales bacterium]
MNTRTKISASFLALVMLIGGSAALANSMSYIAPTSDQGGKFTGELPIAQIGPLSLPDGVVKFSDDEMIVEAVPDWLFDHDVVLKGVIVRAEVAANKDTSIVGGLVFFMDGQWLKNLGPKRTPDVITTVKDEVMSGRIVARAGQAFVFQPEQGGTRKVNFSDVKSIVSPRAFSFNIPTPTARLSPTDNSLSFDSNLIRVSPSIARARFAHRPSVPQSTLAGADTGISNRAIGTFIALDIISEIAPAITAPLVLNPSTQKHAIKLISDALNNSLGLNTPPATSGTGM